MSPRIRPLPIEAASQRTENGAATTTTSTSGNSPEFDSLLGRQVEAKEPDKKTLSRTEPAKDGGAQPLLDATPWVLAGVDILRPLPGLPPVIREGGAHASGTEFGSSIRPVIGSAPGQPESRDWGTVEAGHKAPGGDQPDKLLPEPKQPPTPAVAPDVKDLPPLQQAKLALFSPADPEPSQKADGTPVAKQDSMLLMPEKSADLSSKELGPALTAPARIDFPKIIEPRKTLTVLMSGLTSDLAKNGAPADRSSSSAVKAIYGRPSEQPAEPSSGREALSIDPVFSFEPRLEITPLPETQSVSEVRPVDVLKPVEQQVHILRASGQKELEVLLRPDAHTEIYLHIRSHDGQLQLQARCERGDFRWLESQWSAVQSSLGAQGVRVEPLEAAFRAQNNPAHGAALAHDGGGQRGSPRSPEIFSEQEISQRSTIKRTLSAAPLRGRGWQSWA